MLTWWFDTEHLVEQADGTLTPFRYYFAQREAVETVIWLYDVRGARDKFDLLRFDASGAVSANMFDEDWPRFVVKMATGAGKTKVLSLLIAWSFFHKLYEPDSALARNFLVIAPNIIVLDRLRADFDGLRIFFNDPVLPDNGHDGRNWRDDFQITLHIQDDVRIVRADRQHLPHQHPSRLSRRRAGAVARRRRPARLLPRRRSAPKPVGKTTDSKTDLGEIVREIDELAVFNDEAHHIHDPRMAWFKSIQDIHHRMLQKDLPAGAPGRRDRHAAARQRRDLRADRLRLSAGRSDPPERRQASGPARCGQPRQAARAQERAHSPRSTTTTSQLGVEEWRKSYAEHETLGKKAVLFVMVDDTRNCDEVGAYLEKICPELQGAVLVIHTKNNGEISEAASGKNKEELETAARSSRTRSTPGSRRYKAIVSVLMLKEGWDVRNVTTIVGLRAYAAKSNILPEQTLGRGLRRMYFGSGSARRPSRSWARPRSWTSSSRSRAKASTFERVPMGGGAGRARRTR